MRKNIWNVNKYYILRHNIKKYKMKIVQNAHINIFNKKTLTENKR